MQKKKRPICSILCIKFLDKNTGKRRVCVCVFHKLQGLLQKCKAGSTFKSSQTIHHINRLQKKSHMITSAEREKVFDKIQHQFIMKALCKWRKPTKLGLKHLYKNPILSSYLMVKQLNAFITLRIRHGVSSFIISIQHCTGNSS